MHPALPEKRSRQQLDPPPDLSFPKSHPQLSFQAEDNITRKSSITTPDREMLEACRRPIPMLELDLLELLRAEMS
jgi:hypothetical protein